MIEWHPNYRLFLYLPLFLPQFSFSQSQKLVVTNCWFGKYHIYEIAKLSLLTPPNFSWPRSSFSQLNLHYFLLCVSSWQHQNLPSLLADNPKHLLKLLLHLLKIFFLFSACILTYQGIIHVREVNQWCISSLKIMFPSIDAYVFLIWQTNYL